MQRLTLTSGAVVIIDDQDFDLVSRWKWKQHKGGYAYRTIRKSGKWMNLYMHRLILTAPSGMEIDHINRNPLDNRRCNLRVVEHWQNAHNRDLPNTQRRGVLKPKGRNRWTARIEVNKKRIYLGSFGSEQDAILAYQAATVTHGTQPK